MKNWCSTLILIACAAFAGCSSNTTCDDPQRYQAAQPGVRVEPPEDLDNLNPSKEMTVPNASPREPRPEGSPCLDMPPKVKLES
jgi:hypothetical protein